MKIKSLIKLICLLVIVVLFSLWAFGANISLFGKKFIAWDENMIKGNDIGSSYGLVYTISAPTGDTGFDVHAEAINAVNVYKERVKIAGYKNASVRLLGNDSVLLTLPFSEISYIGLPESFAYNGKLTVKKDGAATLFTEADVESAKKIGSEATSATSGVIYVEVAFKNEAKAKIIELTSNGAYSFKFALDETKVTATFTGSDVIKNGKMTLQFTDEQQASDFISTLQSGAINGTISGKTLYNATGTTSNYDYGFTGTAGRNAVFVLAMCALAIILLATIYFVISNKLFGLAAALSVFVGSLAYYFFVATFSWLSVDAGAIAGIAIAMILMVAAHIIVMENVSRQYFSGKDVLSALDTGAFNARKIVFEISCVAAVLGIGLWIVGAGFASFGIALMGGAAISAIVSIFVFKFITKIFIGLGANNAKAFGLKRGE